MIATTTHPVCRVALMLDDLSVLRIGPDEYINRDAVLVAVVDEVVVGGMVIWDSGHSVVKVDNFLVDPRYPTAGPQLVLTLNAWCQEHGKSTIDCVTPSLELAYQGRRRGALVTGPNFQILYPVTDRQGAAHGG